jgi:hypothetical protein
MDNRSRVTLEVLEFHRDVQLAQEVTVSATAIKSLDIFIAMAESAWG